MAEVFFIRKAVIEDATEILQCLENAFAPIVPVTRPMYLSIPY